MFLTGYISQAADNGHYLITTADGLSNSSVNCIHQDHNGLMWFGTWDGLDIYNGHNIKVFKNEPGDESSLLDNIVRGIVQEDSTHFWIITDWGVNRMDTATGKFSRFRLGYDNINSYSGGGISLVITEDGTILCSSNGWGIASYDRATDKLIPFNVHGLATFGINGIIDAGNGQVLVTFSDGSVSRISCSQKDGEIEAHLVENVLPGKHGIYLTASDEKSIFLLGKSKIYEYDKEAEAVTDSIRFTNPVSSAAFAPDGRLCVIADRSSVYAIDFHDHSVERIDFLGRDNLLCLMFGSQDIVWLAIDGVGVEAHASENDPLRKISSRSLFPKGGSITSLAQTEGGDIYVNVLGSGLYMLGPDGSAIGQVKSSIISENGYNFSIVNGPDGDLLVGIRNAVLLYSPKTGGTKTLYRFEANPPVLPYCMCYDKGNNCIWLGTLTTGIIRLNIDRQSYPLRVKSVQNYIYSATDTTSLSCNNILTLTLGDSGTLWAGTLGGGINRLNIGNGRFTRYGVGEGGSEEIPSNNARHIMQDGDSSLWVGTSCGLSHGTKNHDGTWSFVSYGKDKGLPDNTIQSILKDGDGHIWVATNDGLAEFIPESGKFTDWSSSGSLQSKEFYINSCLKSSNGELWFGGVNGLNHFSPNEMRARDFVPKIMLEFISVKLDSPKSIRSGEPLVLKSEENFFNISFSAIEYINNGNCTYSYILEGFNEDWVTVPAGTPAVFTNVPPGKYTFKVRSTNGDNVWCDNTECLKIKVRSPWYLTIWALIGYLLLAATAFTLISQYRAERRKQEERIAEEAREKQAQKETYEAKLTFFTNIAHEFGTPLTLISCSSEQLEQGNSFTMKDRKNIRIINDNAARMQRLIQELLEFRKIEYGAYELKYSVVDAAAMINSILKDFAEVGETRNVTSNLRITGMPERFICDASALEKIFINLISNAYKYTPDNGTVDILLEGKDGGIHSVIANTSKGLSDEKLAKVFDRFVILDSFERKMAKGKVIRNGVGMALVKALVTSLKGDISVDSIVGESVTFEFSLPSVPEESITADPVLTENTGQERPVEDLPAVSDSDEKSREETARAESGKPAVLVVDDEAQICDIVGDILENECRVIKAGNGAEAMEVLNTEKIELVITDINMPEMDGKELLRRMKENEPTRFIPVVILAMKTDVTDEISSYSLGGDAFIPKPFLPAQILAIVRNILQSRSGLKNWYNSSASDTELFHGIKMRSKDKQFILSVVKLVESNITDNLSPAAVASRLNVGEMTLYRRLKGIIGETPGTFIRNIKLHYAAKLLRTTTLTVQEVMFDSGFNNKSWFYRKFADMYGMSPNEFREKQ